MDVKKIFGSNLHSYRKLRGFSQEQLAEKLNISTKHLSTLETGKVFASAELIEKFSETLNVSVSSLFYTSEDKSLDDSELSKISLIIDSELNNTLITLKEKIRLIKS
jgi:transcriptional regulator with XRE-family HTH domain